MESWEGTNDLVFFSGCNALLLSSKSTKEVFSVQRVWQSKHTARLLVL